MENTNDMLTEDETMGFDDADFADETADGTQTEPEASEEPAEEEPTEAPEQPVEAQEQPAEPGKEEDPDAGIPEKITIKHLKENVDVPREQVREMLRKGYDYDRVREQRDAAAKQLSEQAQWRQQNEGILSTLEAVAKQAGTDVPGLVQQLRVNLYRNNGASKEEALAKIAAEDAQAKLNAMQQQQQAQQMQQAQKQSRAQQEFLEFNKRFPGVKIQDVPQAVIQKAAAGEMSLANAYQAHLYDQLKAENQRLQQTINARKQNETNKQNTMGSAQTSGPGKTGDPFLEALFSD